MRRAYIFSHSWRGAKPRARPMGFWAGERKKLCSHLSPAALGEVRFKWWSRPALYKGREISKECVWGREKRPWCKWLEVAGGGLKDDLNTWASKKRLSPHPHPHSQLLWSPVRWQLHWPQRRRVYLLGRGEVGARIGHNQRSDIILWLVPWGDFLIYHGKHRELLLNMFIKILPKLL